MPVIEGGATRSEDAFKPGYEGERPSTRLTPPEKGAFLQAKAKLVTRLHDAMLSLGALGGTMDLGMGSGAPSYLAEFGDRVGEEVGQPERARFRPTPAQISDMDAAFRLLDGLRPPWFKVVFFRAHHEFQRANGEAGDWPWKAIGGRFGLSDRWAESAYDAALVQAARRAGILPLVAQDHAILICGAWVERAWLSSLGSSSDPRQDAANLRSKSPVRLEAATALWTSGRPVAKRIIEAAKPKLRNLLDHGAWYKASPDSLADVLIAEARALNLPWHMEDLPTGRRAA